MCVLGQATKKPAFGNAGLSRRNAVLFLESDSFFRALFYTGLAGSAIIRTGNLGFLVLDIKHFTRANI
jgi:hypothetical protein